jgi:hypothetical protein
MFSYFCVGIELGLLIVGQKRSDPCLLVGPDCDNRRARSRWISPRVAEIQQPLGGVVVDRLDLRYLIWRQLYDLGQSIQLPLPLSLYGYATHTIRTLR